MTKSEKNKILLEVANWSDKKLEQEYYNLCLNDTVSYSEEMYDRGFDIQDCIEEDKRAKYCQERCNILEETCQKRGIKLFE